MVKLFERFLPGRHIRKIWSCFQACFESFLKDKSGVDKIIVKKQSYQLMNTSREFFPSFQALNFHKFGD